MFDSPTEKKKIGSTEGKKDGCRRWRGGVGQVCSSKYFLPLISKKRHCVPVLIMINHIYTLFFVFVVK